MDEEAFHSDAPKKVGSTEKNSETETTGWLSNWVLDNVIYSQDFTKARGEFASSLSFPLKTTLKITYRIGNR